MSEKKFSPKVFDCSVVDWNYYCVVCGKFFDARNGAIGSWDTGGWHHPWHSQKELEFYRSNNPLTVFDSRGVEYPRVEL